MDLYREIVVWKRIDTATAMKYCCFQELSSGKYTVQSADFFRMPLLENQFRASEKQLAELFIEISIRDRCPWSESIEEAIAAHEKAFQQAD